MNAGYVENAQTFSNQRRLFRYVAKMAADEYEKCASIHTSQLDRFEVNHPGSSRFELEHPTYSK